MTIPKISSQDLNDVLASAKKEITVVKNKMDNIKEDLNTKLKIMTYEADYMNCEFCNLKNGAYTRSNNLKTFNKYCDGIYNIYGSSVTADFIKKPVNLFNMQAATSGEMFFRNDVNVTINGETNKNNLNILKHDSIKNKTISFYELDSNSLTLEVTMDNKNLLGPSKFNMIEIDPFLPGSFDIEKISIFYKNQDGNIMVTPHNYTNIKSVGKQRIVLNKKYDMYKIVFNIKLNYVMNRNDKNIYPFGLKHLYFYDADFKNDSYIVTTVDRQQFISIIKNDIYMMTSTGEYISSIDKEKIEVYSTYSEGAFEDRIYPSTPLERNEIARNINSLYIKIPLKTNQSLIGIGFYVETKKDDLFFDNNKTVFIDRIFKDGFLEGPYYSKTIPHNIVSVPNNFVEDNEKKKADKSSVTYNTLTGFGKMNNLFEHNVKEGFVLHSDTDIPYNDISINANNVYIIKKGSDEKVNAILENDKKNCNLTIKPIYPLDYDSQYNIFFSNLILDNGVQLPNYKAEFTTEDYDISTYNPKYFIETINPQISVELDFEPDKEYMNEKYIFMIDKNSNKVSADIQYSKGSIIITPKPKLSENNKYIVYIKKGVRNTSLQKTLVKTIKQEINTCNNNFKALKDKLFVPTNAEIKTKIEKDIDITNSLASKFIYLLDENNRKVQITINYDIENKELIILPKDKLKSDSNLKMVVEEDMPLFNSEESIGTTIVQNISTRNESLIINEFDDFKNKEYARFFVPSTHFELIHEFNTVINKDTVNKDSIIVLDEFFNVINYETNLIEDKNIQILLNNLKKDSVYYIILTNKIMSINKEQVAKDIIIYTIKTESLDTTCLTEKFLVPNDKIFSINTGSTIGQECLNNKYIYVIDNEHKIVPTLINQPINGCLSIKPPNEKYKNWTKYSIVVDKFIKDNKGISLLKPMLQNFNTIDNENNIEYETMNDINNNHIFNIEMEVPVAKEFLNTNYIYIVDNDYNKLNNINIEYGAKDGDVLSNIIRVFPSPGTTYPLGNLKLVISKDIKNSKKTKIILFRSISPQ